MPKNTKLSQRRSNGSLAFNDLLFNVLVGFVMLFVIAFLLINPPTKKEDVPSKAEVLIILEWEDEAADDVDLWVQRNNERPVGFSNKVVAPLHLDRDDLGWSNDRVVVDGQVKIIRTNIETMTLRGNAPGNYYVSVHYYNQVQDQVKYKVTVMKVNPFKQVYSVTGVLSSMREEQRLPAFTIDKDNMVTDVFNHARSVVMRGGG